MNDDGGNAAGPYSIGSTNWPGASRLIEEMGELYQVLGKLIGTGGEAEHWGGTNLRSRLIDEIADVTGALEFFVTANDLPRDIINARASEKLLRYNKWHSEHRARGE